MDANAQPLREKLLALASATRNWESEPDRRRSVLGVMRQMIQPGISEPPCSGGEVLASAYGEGGAATYWAALMDSAEADEVVAKHLAAHKAVEDFLRDYREWVKFDVTAIGRFRALQAQCREALSRLPGGPLSARLAELVRNPNTQHLAPSSLRALFETKDNADAQPPAKAKDKHPGGAPEKFDWGAVQIAVAEECKKRNGVPCPDHPDMDWRVKAHAMTYVRDRMEKEWADGGPGETRLREHVSEILADIPRTPPPSR